MLDAEVVDGREDQGKSGKEGVEDGKVKGDVQRPGNDDRFGDEHVDRPEEGEMEQELQSSQA